MSCWLKDDEYARVLLWFGFRKVEWPTYFGVKVLKDSDKFFNVLERPENWRLTMGDSDVF